MSKNSLTCHAKKSCGGSGGAALTGVSGDDEGVGAVGHVGLDERDAVDDVKSLPRAVLK